MSRGNRRPQAPFRELSVAESQARFEAAFSGRDPERPLWVFGYGSLMWNPCFVHDRRAEARLEGYLRRFGIWTALARGTPERPGLGLGLEAGSGACVGIAYRLAAEELESGLTALWAREMVTGIYHATWVELDSLAGPLQALTFVVDPSHYQYAGPLPLEEAAAIIAAAHGKFGSCRDYLANTVDQLRRLGCPEPELDALLRRVDEIADARRGR